jgi:hypothetical protein
VRIARGQRCTVERLDGLTLWVRIGAEEYLADTRSGAPPPAASGEAAAPPT